MESRKTLAVTAGRRRRGRATSNTSGARTSERPCSIVAIERAAVHRRLIKTSTAPANALTTAGDDLVKPTLHPESLHFGHPGTHRMLATATDLSKPRTKGSADINKTSLILQERKTKILISSYLLRSGLLQCPAAPTVRNPRRCCCGSVDPFYLWSPVLGMCLTRNHAQLASRDLS